MLLLALICICSIMRRFTYGHVELIWVKLQFSFLSLFFPTIAFLIFSRKRALKNCLYLTPLYLAAFTFIALILTSNLIIDSIDEPVKGYVIGSWYSLFFIYSIICFLIAIAALALDKLKAKSVIESKRINILIAAVLIFAIASLLKDSLQIAELFRSVYVLPIRALTGILMSFLIIYALLKYELFVIKLGVEEPLAIKKRYELPGGYIYLVKSEKADKSYAIFKDMVFHGVEGLCITRMNPKFVRERYNLQRTPIRWLSTVSGENNIDPTRLELLVTMVKDFMKVSKHGIVLLDGVEYLIAHNDFKQILRMLEYLNEAVMVNQARLIIPIDPRTLGVNELALLERNMELI